MIPPAKGCGPCRYADPEAELCRWADQNALPLGLPFWMRPQLTFVDADEGADCDAFEWREAGEAAG